MHTSATACRVRFEPAKESDDGELRALLHKTPMGGSISVAFLREPGYFSATRIQEKRLLGLRPGRCAPPFSTAR